MIYIIGAGGGTYHGLAMLRVLAAKHDLGRKIRIWDGDHYEERNEGRQAWNLNPGEPKVNGAAQLGSALGFDVVAIPEFITEEFPDPKEGEGNTLVVGAADNDQARKIGVRMALECKEAWPRSTVVYATAGNDTEHGQGIAAKAVDGAFPKEVRKRHPDVFSPITDTDRRAAEDARIPHCGDNQDQSMISNMRTVLCLAQAIDAVFGDQDWAEVRWSQAFENPETIREWFQK